MRSLKIAAIGGRRHRPGGHRRRLPVLDALAAADGGFACEFQDFDWGTRLLPRHRA